MNSVEARRFAENYFETHKNRKIRTHYLVGEGERFHENNKGPYQACFNGHTVEDFPRLKGEFINFFVETPQLHSFKSVNFDKKIDFHDITDTEMHQIVDAYFTIKESADAGYMGLTIHAPFISPNSSESRYFLANLIQKWEKPTYCFPCSSREEALFPELEDCPIPRKAMRLDLVIDPDSEGSSTTQEKITFSINPIPAFLLLPMEDEDLYAKRRGLNPIVADLDRTLDKMLGDKMLGIDIEKALHQFRNVHKPNGFWDRKSVYSILSLLDNDRTRLRTMFSHANVMYLKLLKDYNLKHVDIKESKESKRLNQEKKEKDETSLLSVWDFPDKLLTQD